MIFYRLIQVKTKHFRVDFKALEKNDIPNKFSAEFCILCVQIKKIALKHPWHN
jgi:hypothetical protein